MGGQFELLTYCSNENLWTKIEEVLLDAEKEVARVESLLTDFKESEFNQINEFAGLRPVKVCREIIDVIKKAIDISIKSNGVFDISYASLGHAWRIAKADGRVLSNTERLELLNYINYRDIILNESESTVFLPHRKMKIGLGGIGKGYAVDQVYDLLIERGLQNFFINGAGDIRVHSAKDSPRPWRVGIKNPFSKDLDKTVGYLKLKEGSVASSGGYIKNNSEINFPNDHHIVNPKDGHSSSEIIASTVYSSTALESDTTATLLMNLNVPQALEYLNHNKVYGFVIDNQGKTHLSNRAFENFAQLSF